VIVTNFITHHNSGFVMSMLYHFPDIIEYFPKVKKVK